jgi:hypothetical protein
VRCRSTCWFLDAHATDHIPDEDMPDVDKAAHAVSQEAIDAGVWVCGQWIGRPEGKHPGRRRDGYRRPTGDRRRTHGDRGALTRGSAQMGCQVGCRVPLRPGNLGTWIRPRDRSTRCSVRQITESRVPTTPDHAPEQRCPSGRIDRSSAERAHRGMTARFLSLRRDGGRAGGSHVGWWSVHLPVVIPPLF